MIGLIFQAHDDQAYAMFHPDVQQQLPLADVQAYCQGVRTANGALKHIDYDGFTETLDDAGKFEKLTVNFTLACENGPADATVSMQFVGLYGAVVGCSITKQVAETPAQPLAAGTKTYRNQLDKLSKSHVEDFVPFAFSFPDSWTPDTTAGTDASPNVVKVSRNIDLDGGLTFTQENFAVGSCQVPGSGELANQMLQMLSQQFQTAIAKGFPEYQLNREGDMKFGDYVGFGFDFTSKLPHPNKGKVDCWGRVILFAPSTIHQDHGLSVIMLATSEAPELTGLADLGVKGQLPVIINSFKIGTEENPPAAPGAPVARARRPRAPCAPAAPGTPGTLGTAGRQRKADPGSAQSVTISK